MPPIWFGRWNPCRKPGREEHALIGIHLHFRKESHAGEQMKSLLFRQENLTCHHIMQGDELRAEAVLEWDV